MARIRVGHHRDDFGRYEILRTNHTGTWLEAVGVAEGLAKERGEIPWKVVIAKDPTPGRRWNLAVWFQMG